MNNAWTRRVLLHLLLLLGCLILSQLPASATTVYSTSFENFTASNWQGWSASNGVWDVGVPTSGPGGVHEGTKCAATTLDGNYPAGQESRLISPAMNLPNIASGQDISLKFWQWFSFSRGHSYSGNPSSGLVQVQEWSGSAWGAWTTVSNLFDSSSGGTKYSCYQADISSYAGKRIRIGFLHHGGYYAGIGWYIDAVHVDVDAIEDMPLNQTVSFEDFSTSDWHGWYASNGTWDVGSPTSGPNNAHEGIQCAGTVLDGDYPSGHDSTLISPAMNLPNITSGQDITLKFWQWFSFSGGHSYSGNPSSGVIQVQEWSGSAWGDWTTLSNSFSSNTGGTKYSCYQSDLSTYAGKRIRIGFLHHGGYYAGIGWYIDAVHVDVDAIEDMPLNQTVSFEDFSTSDWHGWYASNGTWDVGSPTSGPNNAHEGIQCAGTVLDGDYPSGHDSTLISPAMNLPNIASGQDITLKFWQWFSFSGGHSYSGNPSSGVVQVQEWSGSAWGDWTTLSNSFNSNTGGTKYSCYQSDLSTYAGKRIRIGFQHHGGYYAGIGWYIDAVHVDVDAVEDMPLNKTVSFEDFSTSDWHGWYASNGTWNVGNPTSGPNSALEGVQCAATVLDGNYPSGHDSTLISPAMNLPTLATGQDITLSFWQWFSFSGGHSYSGNPSSGVVQVQEWSGSAWGDWTTISDVFTGNSGGLKYTGYIAYLTAYAGKRVRIGFFHHGGYYDGVGWYIDEVTIVAPIPNIISFNPTSGKVGTVVAIEGENFTSTTAVKFNGTTAEFTVVSDFSITATVPVGASTGYISVTAPGGTATSPVPFTVTSGPTITSFSPASGKVGDSVTITGTNFTGTTAVKFNGTAAVTFSVVSATSITATVPSGATTGKLSVTTPGGTATSSSDFTVIPAPTISSFAPTSGKVGDSVTITGTNFTGATAVKFNGTAVVTYTVVSATSITATVPVGATTGKLSVTTPGGTATSSSDFTVIPAPIISSFSPTSGKVGDSVSITGTNFTGATAVKFNGTAAVTFSVVSATSINATVPVGATTGKLAVTTPGGTATSAGDYTVIPAPTISSFQPSSGKVGDSVSITGNNFTGAIAVKINGTSAVTFSVVSATSITATVPVGATTGKIAVTTPGGTATSSGDYTVIPAPTISSFQPTSGKVGDSVSITGTNFTGASVVKFNGTTVVTFTVVSSTSITATVPVGATTGKISVTTPGGTATSSGDYTVIPAPTISSFAPTSGKVGDMVTITGTNFTGATAVKFNGTAAVTYTVVSNTSITATVPDGAATGKLSVATPGGSATSTDDFTVKAFVHTWYRYGGSEYALTSSRVPWVDNEAEAVSVGGHLVTIESAAEDDWLSQQFANIFCIGMDNNPSGAIAHIGYYLNGSNYEWVSGITSSYSSMKEPAGNYTFMCVNPHPYSPRYWGTGAQHTTGSNVTYGIIERYLAPTISSFSPTSGKVGDTVTITGDNFTDATGVKFNSTAAITYTVVSNTSITATVPSGTTTGKISVTTSGGTATSIANFTIVPAPTISSFSPTSGKVGDSITITGTNFTGATAVKFNGTTAVTYTVVSATSITATVPVGATTGKLSVTTPGGTATSSSDFTVYQPPTITSFSPTSGKIGDSVTITGTNFTGATVVKFNGTTAVTYTVVSATTITATVPSGATTGKISVTTPGGTATSTGDFTVIPAPTISSFQPSSGKVGDSVSITGTNFSGATVVKFNGTAAVTYTVVSATSITATVPVGATTGKIAVTTPGGTATSSSDFTVIPAPTISSFQPASGKVGDSVSITGTNFTGATAVKFNGTTAATYTVVSATSITVTVPVGATTGKLSVTTPSGTSTSSGDFTVIPAPTITSFSPTTSRIGDTVTLTGTNFTGATAVKFNGTAAVTYTVVSATSIMATVPVGATTGKLSVTTPGGTATSSGDFTVIPAPTVTSFAPTSGAVGQVITITGTNFTGATSVKFNGTAASFSLVSATSITATIPSGATTGKISVTTPSGVGTSATDFTVYQPTSLVVTIDPGVGYTGAYSGIALSYSLVGTQTYAGALALNGSGKALIGGLEPGRYTLSITGSHWLRRIVAGINVDGVNSVNTTITNGDADGGNSINLFDFVVLDSKFGSSDAMADLNGDGAVNLFDYVVIDQNFGAMGD